MNPYETPPPERFWTAPVLWCFRLRDRKPPLRPARSIPWQAARCVAPERLDLLPAHHPEAIRSRRDLRRLNRIMGHGRVLGPILRRALPHGSKVRIAELGGGDGSLMLDVAEQNRPAEAGVDLTLVDRHDLLESSTLARFEALNWRAQMVREDLFEWFSNSRESFDVIVANLVLHHFNDDPLRDLFRHVATRTRVFIALEPRRAIIPALLSRMLWAIGCGPVTRYDGPISVRAGFARRELSALWPADAGWALQEERAGPFSHLLLAQRPG